MLVRCIALLVAALASAGPCYADEKPDPRRSPDTALAEALRLLEAKEYDTFVRKFLPPDEAAKELTTPEKAKSFIKGWAEEFAPAVLEELRSVKGAKADLGQDGQAAKFVGKDKAGKEVTVQFRKVGKLWYLQ